MTGEQLSRRASLFLLMACATAPGVVAAHSTPIAVIGAWTRPVPAGMNGAGYLTIVNRGRIADRLIGASSPAAVKVSIHQSRQVGGVMTMRAIPFLDVGAGGRVSLAPGGLHLMLEGLRRPLRVGQSLPVSLIFAVAGQVRANLIVREAAPAMPGMAM
jgi:hypothetical protein